MEKIKNTFGHGFQYKVDPIYQTHTYVITVKAKILRSKKRINYSDTDEKQGYVSLNTKEKDTRA